MEVNSDLVCSRNMDSDMTSDSSLGQDITMVVGGSIGILDHLGPWSRVVMQPSLIEMIPVGAHPSDIDIVTGGSQDSRQPQGLCW